ACVRDPTRLGSRGDGGGYRRDRAHRATAAGMNAANSNPVGIIGAGRLGQAMARTVVRAGRSVVIANSRGPDSLTSVVSALGEGAAGTVDQASAAGIVVIAVPWDRVPDAVMGLAWNGQIVIDATN